MMWNNGWGWAGWLIGTIMMLGFWALVAWLVVTFVRRPADTTTGPRTAEDILAERFARGEIDADEYHQRRDALRGKQTR